MTTSPAGPIEVWLTQKNMTITCTVVHEDERTDELDVGSLSMRGAQREMTGHLIKQGYKPDGRWSAEFTERSGPDIAATETSRRFKVA